MQKLTSRHMKKLVIQGMFVAAFTVLAGFQTTGVAAQVEHLWTIMIHSRFPDGSEYDFVLVRGVPTANLDENLAICGRSHGVRQEMKYYCYAVPE